MLAGIDDTYQTMYSSLEQEDLTGKLVFVHPPSYPSPIVRQMAVRSVQSPDLFIKDILSPVATRRPGHLVGIPEPSVNSSVITNGGLISPQSESQVSTLPSPPPVNRSPESLRHIDPTKVSFVYRSS